MNPTGRQFVLRRGDYTAAVTEQGATLRSLHQGDRPLVAGFDAAEAMPEFNGALLAPWPNRIGDGRYRFDGEDHQLAVSEPDRHTALHGLVAWQGWTPVTVADDDVQLATTLFPQRGYPFRLTMTARYTLTGAGLTITVGARNDGTRPAPYGVSMHPWFLAADGGGGGGGGIADWTMTLPAARVLDTDERLLPVGSRPVDETYDFRAGRTIGDTVLDDAFTDIAFDAGVARATLLGPSGAGVALGWHDDCRWLQVCTGDEAGPALNRRAVAIEPMTCPPDAFSSGTDVIRLEPGEQTAVTWTITALG